MTAKGRSCLLGMSIALVLAAMVVTSGNAAPTSEVSPMDNCFPGCVCDADFTVDCWNLTSFPSTFPGKTKSLNIQDSKIAHIKSELHHPNLGYLQHFACTGCQVESIADDAFLKNRYLKTIDLSNNSFVDLPVAPFLGLYLLRHVRVLQFSDCVEKMKTEHKNTNNKTFYIITCKESTAVTEKEATTKPAGKTIASPETTEAVIETSTSAASAPSVPSSCCAENPASDASTGWLVGAIVVLAGCLVIALLFIAFTFHLGSDRIKLGLQRAIGRNGIANNDYEQAPIEEIRD